jgi:hypothetical protein
VRARRGCGENDVVSDETRPKGRLAATEKEIKRSSKPEKKRAARSPASSVSGDDPSPGPKRAGRSARSGGPPPASGGGGLARRGSSGDGHRGSGSGGGPSGKSAGASKGGGPSGKSAAGKPPAKNSGGEAGKGEADKGQAPKGAPQAADKKAASDDKAPPRDPAKIESPLNAWALIKLAAHEGDPSKREAELQRFADLYLNSGNPEEPYRTLLRADTRYPETVDGIFDAIARRPTCRKEEE